MSSKNTAPRPLYPKQCTSRGYSEKSGIYNILDVKHPDAKAAAKRKEKLIPIGNTNNVHVCYTCKPNELPNWTRRKCEDRCPNSNDTWDPVKNSCVTIACEKDEIVMDGRCKKKDEPTPATITDTCTDDEKWDALVMGCVNKKTSATRCLTPYILNQQTRTCVKQNATNTNTNTNQGTTYVNIEIPSTQGSVPLTVPASSVPYYQQLYGPNVQPTVITPNQALQLGKMETVNEYKIKGNVSQDSSNKQVMGGGSYGSTYGLPMQSTTNPSATETTPSPLPMVGEDDDEEGEEDDDYDDDVDTEGFVQTYYGPREQPPRISSNILMIAISSSFSVVLCSLLVWWWVKHRRS